MWAEISSRRPSEPVMLTGGASPLSTTTTYSSAASWWFCSPSSSTCCGSGAFTGGCCAVGQQPPSGWKRAFRPRKLREPYEQEKELELPGRPSKGKAIFASGFLLFIFILFFSFPFCSLKQKQNPLCVNSAILEDCIWPCFVHSFKLRCREKGKSLHICYIGHLPKIMEIFGFSLRYV